MSNSDNEKVTRTLRAILSADVKGYSLLMADDELHTIQTLKAYRKIMSDLIQQQSGRVVDNPGDNLLAEFGSAVDAVDCAVQIQNRLKKENAKFVEDRRLQFRIGVNIGDVVQDGDRIYGSGVNVAARIEGIADPGGICVSRNTYDQVKGKLELGFDYLGEHSLKNIKEPVRVYKVLMGTDAPKPLVEEKLELPDKPSIAVLPFTNMSGDPSQEYFSDGLTEQIINGLCKVPNLFVIARNSSFAYKGKSISVKQIAKELGVRYVLEGSVQRADDRVRITAQLIDAVTDYHMWSENYDRDLKDIFALQDEITIKLMRSIEINLTKGDQARLWVGGTTDIQAYDKALRGEEHVTRMSNRSNLLARKFYEEAVGIDSSYATAWAGLGSTYVLDILYGWSKSPLQSFAEADKCVSTALSIDDSNDKAHGLLGWIKLFQRQHKDAKIEGERSVELNPNAADSLIYLALTLSQSDETQEAVRLCRRAIRQNPYPPAYYYHILGISYRSNGEYEKAIEISKYSLGRFPDMINPYITLASCYALLGQINEAIDAGKELLSLNPAFSVNHWFAVMPCMDRDICQRYADALRKAGLPD